MYWRLFFWLFAAAFPFPLLLSLAGFSTQAWATNWAVLLGVVAYAWWLLAILLSTRPRWVDRKIGLPSIYAVHGLLGICALIAAYLHKDNSSTGIALAQQFGDIGFYLSLALTCYALFIMSGWITDRVQAVANLKAAYERLVKHTFAIWIHRLNLVVLALIWMHVHLFPSVTNNTPFIVTFNVMTVGTLSVYAWKKFFAPRNYTTGVITRNSPLNDRTQRVEITLDQASATTPSTQPQPGDFYFLRFDSHTIPREWHPFSLTEARPDVAAFTIRRIGDFTSQIPQLPTGTKVHMEGPFGLFNHLVQHTPPHTPLVFIGLGAGIAPLMSLADGYLGQRPISVLWGVSSPQDAYYQHVLAQYHQQAPDHFTYAIEVGRLTPEHIRAVMPDDQFTNAVFFIVGPNPAVLAVERHLTRMGVPRNRVHHERLTL